MTEHLRAVVDLLDGGLRVGEPRPAGALALVPLFGGAAAPPYLVGAEAFAAGLLEVREKGSGEVPALVADNRAELPVLLVDGEHLEGARQDRVLSATILLAPRHATVIPVTCVEQGRWHVASRPDLAPAPFHGPARLRAANMEASVAALRLVGARRTDQARAWAEVEDLGRALGGAPSRTRALGDYLFERSEDLAGALRALPEPEPGQTGVVACVGGRAAAADAFDRPETLAKVWGRLVPAYAADALRRRTRMGADEARAAERFLREPAVGELTSHEGVGLGMDVAATSDGAVASALVWEGAVVHVAVLARPGAPGAPPEGRRMRARHFRRV